MGQTLITETWRQAKNCRAYFDGRTDVKLVYFSCNGDAG